jgi:hypothetical protein
LDVELSPLAPSLPAGSTAVLKEETEAPATGVLGVNIWSGVSLPSYGAIKQPEGQTPVLFITENSSSVTEI